MNPDFLVIGAGVAGLRAAIELASAGKVLVVAKDALRESSSEYAQGGVAVALSDDDEVQLHERDTLNAGDGLCDGAAVRTLVEEGPGAIQQLIDWGAEFDRSGAGRLSFTREGAHSRNRILHAHGDSTGREIARTLYHKAASLPNVEFRTYSAVTDLLTTDDGAAGAMVYEDAGRRITPIYARAVLIATGGLGRVYQESTNPEIATGDGVAMAWRAGAEIADIEFVQFHPTALHVEGAPRFLLSEALRGEGAYLLNAAGERFTNELAPRDVVARAIVAELERTGAPHVFLDLTHRGADFIRKRFPRIYETCLHYRVDVSREPAPVHPAAHYAMGGVRTDLNGRTNIPRLYAAGEAACTGVHGANRLASNSLLEAVVFGARAGAAMQEWAGVAPIDGASAPDPLFPCAGEGEVRRLAWEKCGIARTAEALQSAAEWLDCVPMGPGEPELGRFELRSVHQVVSLVARCALAREESRGAHYRTDFPARRPEFAKHSVIRKGREIDFR
ncbi:MAG TPA: L-aspartate oxidase [Bryobacteraceae bacterium]|nr:L-aspartate oxidase [Bryobacteraceae bacterium]